MSEWKTYRLGDICQVLNGRAYKQEELLNQGPYPVLRVGNIFQGNNWYYSDLELPDDKYCYNGDLLYAWSCGFAPYIWKGKKSIYHYHIWKLKENPQIIDKLFFYYYLIIHTKYNLGGTHGSVMLHLTKKDFENQTLHLPPLEEQRRIAGILGSLDDKIELNRRLNANLEAQAQALFRSWFVDFEPFRDGPFVDSELGKIPQGWKVGNYTDIVEIKGGGTPKTGIQEYWDGTIPFFSPKDVGASCFVLDTEKHITAKGLENCNSSLFQTNTVFITARGTVGKVVMTGTEMAMNQTNYALLGKQNISQYYVYHITRQLVTRLLKKANGAVFNAITTRDFTSEQIIIPPFSTIRQFSDVVKPIYENILLNDVQSNRLSALRDTLLPKLMAGEI